MGSIGKNCNAVNARHSPKKINENHHPLFVDGAKLVSSARKDIDQEDACDDFHELGDLKASFSPVSPNNTSQVE